MILGPNFNSYAPFAHKKGERQEVAPPTLGVKKSRSVYESEFNRLIEHLETDTDADELMRGV